MTLVLKLFILLPFIGYIINLCIPSKKEALISWTAIVTVGSHFVGFLIFTAVWTANDQPTLNLKDIVLFQTTGFEFFIDFCFDKITAVYFFVGSLLTFLVAVYSKAYLHREEGFKRFFNTILFFYMGYNITILSGNMETLFIGWEILGISSFLLIAFYRNRYLPVKNAVKVFSVYRIGDVGMLLAMWMSHHLWHENITFSKLGNYELVHTHLQSHTLIGVFISLMILVSAAAKSAQLPFSYWLPRAMEGPTPSSAIFYGSLSVHLGIFILLRTYPFWEHQLSVRILIGLLGLVTSIIASATARVQSSVKSQIAYSSVSQIGLIFIEVAAGFQNLALIHFAGNAFLRTYQLLVSPSVVSYLIREQFYNYIPQREQKLHFTDFLPKNIKYSFYILCLKEWNLEGFLYNIYWRPLKWAGRRLGFLNMNNTILFFAMVYSMGLFSYFFIERIPDMIHAYLPAFFALIGLITVLKSFTERKNVMLSWVMIIMNHCWIVLAISFNENFKITQSLIYMSGVVISAILGFICLRKVKSLERSFSLNRYHGYAYAHPKLAFIFLLACLGLAGFPITPTFIGEDLIFSHIHENQAFLAFIVSMSFITNGLSIIRIYARVFLGPHVKSVYEMAYRSS